MSDLRRAKSGRKNGKIGLQSSELREFNRLIGEFLREMRIKRRLSQGALPISQRTIRRIEKGDVPSSKIMAYAKHLGPCIKEMVKCFRMASDILQPICKKCDKECRLFGCDRDKLYLLIQDTEAEPDKG